MSLNRQDLGNKLLKNPVKLYRSVIRGEGGLGEVRLGEPWAGWHNLPAGCGICVPGALLAAQWCHSSWVPSCFGSWQRFHCFPSPQNNASKLLLAIMESRHDSENAERILYNMRPKELVSPGITPELS